MQIGQTLLVLAYISIYLGQLNNLFICFYKQEVNSKIVLKLDLIGVLTSPSSALLIQLILLYGPQSKFIGIIISMIILLIINLYLFYKRGLFSLSFDKEMGKEMILYSIPFMPNYIGGWIMDLSDRIVIAKVVNISSVGIYSVANQLSRVLYIIQDSLTKVQYPMLMKSLTSNDETSFHLIKNFNHKILALIMTIYLSMALFISDILIIFQKQEYLAAKNVFIILGLTFVVTSQYRSSIAIINFKKMNLKISLTSIAAALINLAINLVLIEKIGIIGAAISTVVSSLIYTIVVIKIAKGLKYFEIGFYKIAVMFTILLSSLGIDLYYIDNINNSLNQYFLKIGVLISTSFVLLYISGLFKDIKKKLFNQIY